MIMHVVHMPSCHILLACISYRAQPYSVSPPRIREAQRLVDLYRNWCAYAWSCFSFYTCGRMRSCTNPIKHHMPDPTLFHIYLKASDFRCSLFARHFSVFDLLRFQDEVLDPPNSSSDYSRTRSPHLRWRNMLSPRQKKGCLPRGSSTRQPDMRTIISSKLATSSTAPCTIQILL